MLSVTNHKSDTMRQCLIRYTKDGGIAVSGSLVSN